MLDNPNVMKFRRSTMRRLLSCIISLVFVFSLSSCANGNLQSENKPTSKDFKASNDCIIYDDGYYQIPSEFKPFKCSKNDLAFNNYIQTNNTSFQCNMQNDTVEIIKNHEAKKLFEVVNGFSYYQGVCIGNAFYFNANDKLYRVVVDSDGNYDKREFSLVADFKSVPCYVEENKLLLKTGWNGHPLKYYLLDTTTGRYQDKTDDYNVLVEDTPDSLISKIDAQKSAVNALESGFDYLDVDFNGIVDIKESNLIFKPLCDVDYVLENSPEYCWQVVITGKTNGVVPEVYTVYVNAKTGDISMLNYEPMDN